MVRGTNQVVKVHCEEIILEQASSSKLKKTNKGMLSIAKVATLIVALLFCSDIAIAKTNVYDRVHDKLTHEAKIQRTAPDAYPSFSRHTEEITNEKELYIIEVHPLRLNIDSLIRPDTNRVRASIVLTLDKHLINYFEEFISSSIDDIEFTIIPERRLKRIGRNLATVVSRGKSTIDIYGGHVLFYGTLYDQLTDDELNEAVREILGAHLFFDDISNESHIEVIDISNPSYAPSQNVVTSQATTGEEIEEVINKEKGGNNGGAIAIGILSVLCFLVATALFAKRKYGFSITEKFKRRQQEGGKEMKRDPFFEEYIVECCTDNDLSFNHSFTL